MSDNSGIENILRKFARNPAGRNGTSTIVLRLCAASAILEEETLSPESGIS
jgi:hypothetical protein